MESAIDINMKEAINNLDNPLTPVAPLFLQAARTFCKLGGGPLSSAILSFLFRNRSQNLKENYTTAKGL